MLLARLRNRVASATKVAQAVLPKHALRFHKRSRDGSAKCDAYPSRAVEETVHGVIFEFLETEKPNLDDAEGLGQGYVIQNVDVLVDDSPVPVFSYFADPSYIDPALQPYDWYKELVIAGALEHSLAPSYIDHIRAVPSVADANPDRARRARAHLPAVADTSDAENVNPLNTGHAVLRQIFDTLSSSATLDPHVLALVREHLNSESVHSKAGQRLAEALFNLAKTRSKKD